MVSSRTYTVAANGSYGQGIPAELREAALTYGDIGRLTGLSQSADGSQGFRSNLGLVNTTSATMAVHVRFFAADGSQLGDQIDVTLEGSELRQLNAPLPANTDVASAVIWTSTPGGRLLVYGSVVDNATGDASYLRVQR